MSKSSSLHRFIALLVFVSLLVSPQAMVAEELDSATVEGSPVAAQEGETNPEEANPEDVNPEAGNPDEGGLGTGTEGSNVLPEEESSDEEEPADSSRVGITAESGSISGQIGFSDRNDGGTWKGVAGAEVCIGTDCVTADSNGNYLFEGMVGGIHWFTAVADGFKPNTNSATVEDGNAVANLSLEQTTVSGQVGYNDSNNVWRGIPGAEVCIEGTDRCTTTDANGYYFFYQVPNGTHWIGATVDGFEYVNNSATVENSDATANIGLQLVLVEDPGLPALIPVEACQVSYAGHTRMSSGVGVDERVKIPNQEDGEVNADGWGTTMRLYAATRDNLTNVTLTYQVVGGGDFGTEINTLQSPAAGALQGNGYTVAATGYNVSIDGNTITVTIASMPANSSLSFNIPVVFAEGQPHMYVHSWMTGTETNCDTVIPPMPEIPVAEVCQQVLAGRTITSGPNANVDVRDKFGEGGEVNADGWGTTFRVYGATDVAMENVVATFTNTQGFSFAGTYDTLSNPGAGNLGNTGYTEPVEGITVTVTETTVTVTIASMPANSSWSVNVPIVIEAETGKLYMDSLMIGDLADCAPAVLELPEITPSVCTEAGQTVPPAVEAPADSDSVTYGDVTSVAGDDGVTFSVTATANDGFTFEGATMPEGWTMVSATEAAFSVTLAVAECEIPAEVVTPEVPALVAAVCSDENEPVDPTLVVPENTDGITYGEVTTGPANSVLLSLTATANEGYTFVGAEMPEGWTMVSPTEAVYEIVADTVECPVTPEEPKPEDPEDPKDKDKKVPEVKELPETGSGSNPAPMIGLAASAAAAIAGAGLFFTNRKR